MKEMWQLYDFNEYPIEVVDRNNPKVWDKGIFHMGADIWMINDDKKILVQKRSKYKKLEPNVWAMTGGSVIYGETPTQTIVREAKEELGIDLNPNRLQFMTEFKTQNVWVKTFILKQNLDISQMIFSEDEVADAKWLTWNEIDDLVKDDNFIQNRWNFVKDYLKEEICNGS